MKIRRIHALDTRKGIQKVKEELGYDAVILANKKLKYGVEIIAAIDYDESIIDKAEYDDRRYQGNPFASSLYPEPPTQFKLSPQEDEQSSAAVNPDQMLMVNDRIKEDKKAYDLEIKKVKLGQAAVVKRLRDNLDLIKRQKTIITHQKKLIQIRTKELARPKVITRVIKKPPKYLPKTDINRIQAPIIHDMHNEIRMLKSTVLNQLGYMGWGQWANSYPKQFDVLKKLSNIGLSTNFSKAIVNEIDESLSSKDAWVKCLGVWSKQLSVTNNDILTKGGVVALVGPTGVGKTTTVAKLAAQYSLKHGARHVGLISCDNFRVGAYEQLIHFGRLLGVPVLTASTKSELEDLLVSMENKKLVLIDTAGMSIKDTRLVHQLDALKSSNKTIRKYLVVSASTEGQALNRIVSSYQGVNLSGCILTKLDEASRLGDAITMAANHKLPFAYVTTGQNVPDDIEPAYIHRLISKAVSMSKADLSSFNDQSVMLEYGSAAISA